MLDWSRPPPRETTARVAYGYTPRSMFTARTRHLATLGWSNVFNATDSIRSRRLSLSASRKAYSASALVLEGVGITTTEHWCRGSFELALTFVLILVNIFSASSCSSGAWVKRMLYTSVHRWNALCSTL